MFCSFLLRRKEDKPKDVRPWIQDFCDALTDGRVQFSKVVGGDGLIHADASLANGVYVHICVEYDEECRKNKRRFTFYSPFVRMGLNLVQVTALTYDEKQELMRVVNVQYNISKHKALQNELDKLIIPVVQESPIKPKKAK